MRKILYTLIAVLTLVGIFAVYQQAAGLRTQWVQMDNDVKSATEITNALREPVYVAPDGSALRPINVVLIAAQQQAEQLRQAAKAPAASPVPPPKPAK